MKINLTTDTNITKSLLLFSLPMILRNILQQFYNIVDTWVVGKYVGKEALASVGASYTLMTFLNSVFIGLCMGSGALFAFYYGSRNHSKMKKCMDTALVFIGGISVVLMIFMRAGLSFILWFLRIPEELRGMTEEYLKVICFGIIFVFLYNYFAYLLRSIGNSVIPLVFLAVASVVNVVLDLWFVIGLGWGLKGTAIATVIAQGASGVGLGIYTYSTRKELRFSLHHFLIKEKPIKEILQFSTITCTQQSVMNFGILLVQGLVNSFGTTVMAAFAAAVKIDTIAYMPAQEFGNAYSMFISQNFGAKKKRRVEKGTKSAFLTSAGFCLLVSAVIFLWAEQFMKIFVNGKEREIIHIGIDYLHIEGACYIGIGILFLLYGYFRGMNRPAVSLLLTVISLGTRVLLAYTLAPVETIGVYGIWWSIPIGWVLADMAGIYMMKKNLKQTDV